MSQIAPLIQLAESSFLSNSLQQGLVHNTTGSAMLAHFVAIGAPLTNTQPVNENVRTIAGGLGRGCIDIFYNRILVEPAEIDVGNLITDQTYTVNVFNAYLDERTVSSITSSGEEGISVSGNTNAPFTFGALQMLQYTYSVSIDGPFAIDAEYVFVIAGASYRVTLRGARLVLLPFQPDWKSGCTESMEWKTNILRSYTGHEQRRQLRRLPRAELSYSTIIHADEARLFDNLMWGWQNRSFGVPFWPDRTTTTGTAASGSTTIPVNTTGYAFRPHGLVVLYNSSSDFEVAEVDTVTPTSLTVASQLARTWPAGTVVFPGFVGHLPASFQMRRINDRLIAGQLTFRADPSSFTSYAPTAAAPTTLAGTEIITYRPNWSADVTWEYQYQFDTVDFGGALSWVGTEERPRIMRTFRWLLSDRTELRQFREQMARLSGMFKSVYIPSWNDDFTLLEIVSPSDTGLVLTDNAFSRYVGNDVSRDGLMVRLRDGTVFYRQINGVSATQDGLTISLTQSFGRAIYPEDVVAIHGLTKYRLASDRIEIKWETDRVATVEANFISVPE